MAFAYEIRSFTNTILKQDGALSGGRDASQVDGKILNAFIRATKPLPKQSCCGPSCCK